MAILPPLKAVYVAILFSYYVDILILCWSFFRRKEDYVDIKILKQYGNITALSFLSVFHNFMANLQWLINVKGTHTCPIYSVINLSAGILTSSMKSAVGLFFIPASTFTITPNIAGMYTFRNATARADCNVMRNMTKEN